MATSSFSNITEAKEEVRILIENLLNIRLKNTKYEKDIYGLSSTCVDMVWKQFSIFLDEKLEDLPYKIPIAIASLTNLVANLEESHEMYNDLLYCLLVITEDFKSNHDSYPLKDIDWALMSKIIPIIIAATEKFKEANPFAMQMQVMMKEYRKTL